MRRVAFLSTLLLLALCLLCGCNAPTPKPIHEGETYLDGLWYLEEGGLHVGYSFFPDGSGYLFIGETVVPIRYGIYNEYLYVSDNGNVESLPFSVAEDGLWIDEMLFKQAEEDSEFSVAVDLTPSEAQQSTAASSAPQAGMIVMQLITLAAAVGVVVILVRFFRNRKKP